MVSSKGSTPGTGILWLWSTGPNGDIIHQSTPLPSTLRAFNAETLTEIYNSDTAANGRDTLGGFAKYTSATIANGKVYVPSSGDNTTGGQNSLVVYGLLADTTPPTIMAANAANVSTQVKVQFSEAVDPVSSQTIGNYAINQGVTISNASLSADQMTVTLTTSTLTTGVTYTLTVNNVKDIATIPNTILANSQISFTYTTIPPTVSITSPVTGATFTAPAAFQITASAAAGGGAVISKVDFILAGKTYTATAAPYTVTITNVAAGTYSILAKATDNTGLFTTTPTPVNITVNAGSATYGLNTRAPIGAYLNAQLPPLVGGSLPATLSAVGAFTDLSALAPSTGLIPYAVNSPLWSDNAVKTRWLAVPNTGGPSYTANQQIGFAPTGEWTFPNGSVFVKHFVLGTDDTNPKYLRSGSRRAFWSLRLGRQCIRRDLQMARG